MAVTNYLWDPIEDTIIGEYDDNGNATSEFTTDSDGKPISEMRGGETYFYHYDGMGNVTEMTDSTGNVVSTRRYSAFGEIIESSGSVDSPFQFGGKMGYYRDQQTGDYYIRARMYARLLGRWTSVDPLTILVALNQYVFANQNPLTYADPSGLQAIPTEKNRCTCEGFVRTLGGPITITPDPTFKNPKFDVCSILIECRDDCDGFPGKAYPPDDGGFIVICLSNKGQDRNTFEIIYEHELEHARQLCGGADLSKCTECVNWETKAHKLSCAIAFPKDIARQAECVQCAVYLSCRTKCKGKPNAPKKPKKKCDSWADLGVYLPDYPFPMD